MADRHTAGADALIGSVALLSDAYELAHGAHDGQQRKDNGPPYLTHPLRVAQLVAEAGFDEEVVAAALLHDVVEDSEVNLSEIARRCGPRVAGIVSALTEDEAIEDYEQRKAEHRDRVEAAGPDAVADLHRGQARQPPTTCAVSTRRSANAPRSGSPPRSTSAPRLWLEDAAMAERVLPGATLAPALNAEAEGYERDRSAALAR